MDLVLLSVKSESRSRIWYWSGINVSPGTGLNLSFCAHWFMFGINATLVVYQGVSKSKHRVFKRPNVGFCKQADFCGTSILNCLILVCMLFCIKGNKKPVKCDRLVKR